MNSIQSLLFPVTELLPHTGSALLLDQLVAYGDDWVEAAVFHQHPSLYTNQEGNVPAWVGIEYMVQTIGLFAGLEAKKNRRCIKPGFLLGTRSFSTRVDYFPPQSVITIRAEMCFRDESNMVMFACTITDKKKNKVADAEIKAIQPENIDDILQELLHA